VAPRVQIVLVLRGDRPAAGATDGDAVVVGDGKRIDRPLVLARGPDAGMQPREAARLWDRRISDAAQGVPTAEIWSLLEGSGEMDAQDLVQAWLGDAPGFEEASALLWAVWNDRARFSTRKARVAPEPADRVEGRLARRIDVERKQARLESLAAAVRAPGRTDVDPGAWRDLLLALRDVAVHGPEATGAAEALEVLDLAGVPSAFDFLVSIGELDRDENLDLMRHAIRTDFPRAVLDEADRVARDIASWSHGREDVRDAVTIDSERTVEVDDALGIRPAGDGWEIGVHIAEASLLPPSGEVVREALGRGASIYTPDLTIPMMPPALGRGGFSLDAGCDRPALSLFASVARDGALLGHRFSRTTLRVARRLSYEQADDLIAASDPVLSPLASACRALHSRRIAAGGIDLDLPEVDVHIIEGEIHVAVTRGTTPSHLLVSECAILYNWLAGRLLLDSSLPGVFRTQPAVEGFPDVRSGPAAEYAARRMLAPASTTTEPGPHFTLGLDVYAQATSPIRRSFDLLVQRQIAAALGSADPLSREDLDRALLAAGPGAAAAAQIERARTRYWLLRYLDIHATGRVLRSVIVDHLSDRVVVHIPEFAIEAHIRTRDPASYPKGSEIEVRLDRADARRDVVRISPVA